MQFLKLLLASLCLLLSHSSFSTSMFESVSEITLNKFEHSIPTSTPGQYLEYNNKLLAVREYNKQGLSKEFTVELSSHINVDSSLQIFLDKKANTIWITDKYIDDQRISQYLIIEKYGFDNNGFTGEYSAIKSPDLRYAKVQGFHNNNMYIVNQDFNATNFAFSFSEYEISDEVSLKRSLAFDEDVYSRLSPTGDFFITPEGIIDLSGVEMTWIDSDLGSPSIPFFIDNETVVFRDYDEGYFIGIINENVITKSLILPSDSSKFSSKNSYNRTEHDITSPRIISIPGDSYTESQAFYINKVDGVWAINDIQAGYSIYSHDYRMTNEGELINRYSNFIFQKDMWTQDEQLLKGFELDNSLKFISNMSDSQDNDLYFISQGDVNTLKKLELMSDNKFLWHDVAEIPSQEVEISFASRYKNNIYLVYNYIDVDPTNGNTTYATNITVIDINGKIITSFEVPYLNPRLSTAINIYNEHIYITGESTAAKCTIIGFYCDDLTPSIYLPGEPQYFNNYLYFYSSREQKLIYYNTKSGTDWHTSAFDLPDGRSDSFDRFGHQLRFEDQVIIFNDDGEIGSLDTISSVNSNFVYFDNNVNYFMDGYVFCSSDFEDCTSSKNENILKFAAIDGDILNPYTQITGTPYLYNSTKNYHFEIVTLKIDVEFPELKQLPPAETEYIWQGETVNISLNDYFNGINLYKRLHTYSPDYDYFDEFIADDTGELTIELTNEHTWREVQIPFSTYAAYNDYFTFPVNPIGINVLDINDPPELRKEKSLIITGYKSEALIIDFDSLFMDPEREDIIYSITNLSLPEGLNITNNSLEKSADADITGDYLINLTATDTSVDKLSSDFVINLHIEDNLPTENSNNLVGKNSSSGGTFSYYFFILYSLVRYFRKVNITTTGRLYN